MAEIALTAVINKAIDISSNALFNEVSSASSLQENIGWIETEMRRMRSYLADAEVKQVSTHGVANLIKDIQQLAQDVENVLDSYICEIASHHEGEWRLLCLKEAARIFSCYGHAAHKLVARVEEIKRRVADIDRARVTYNITDSSSNNKDEIFSTSDQRKSFLHVDESEIIGLEKDCKELETNLLDTNLEFDVISIIGMGGLGKTTLAKRVYRRVKCHFDCFALVYVFQEPRSKELLLEVAKQVGLGEDKMEQNLEINLYTFLKEKRYVIFLDDVWSTKTWEALSSSFPIFANSKNGSRIIITSRNSDIGRYIGGESSIHNLQPLKPEDSWKLFMKILLRASKDNKIGIPSNLEGIGREIVKRCDGVPLPIVLTASLLRAKEKSEHDWNRVLKNMHQDHEQDLDQCNKILGLSYKDLPTSLKPCFLYFALFPEDYEIPVFDLINMWAAEKFITRRGECEIEEVGEFYLNDLVARNLIQVSKRRYDGKIKTCRIHNVLHDLCIKIAKGIKFFHSLSDIVDTTSPSAEGPRRLTVHQRDVDKYLSYHRETPKICALLSFEPIKVPENQKVKDIFPNVGFLRVLNLEILTSPDKYGWSVIGPIGKLIHLSYLRLRGFSDTCLPSSISNLRNLLTLDVRGCDFIRLPTCIWKMEQLRHLQIGALSLFVRFCVGHWGFEESNIVTKHYPIEVNLPNIQTLETMDVCYWNPKWLCKVGPNTRRLAVSGASRETIDVLNNQNNVIFEKLENLRLSNDTTHVISSGNFNLSGYQNLLKMHLAVFFSPSKLPSSENFPPNLIKLTLVKNRLKEDPLQILNKLPKLKILKLDFDCYIGKTMDCDVGFSQLEVLRIRGLDNLEELIVDEAGMPRLKKVMIDWCKQLKCIPERLQKLESKLMAG